MKTRPGFTYHEDSHQWLPTDQQTAEESPALEPAPEPQPEPAPAPLED